jgi:hypothetical protein
MIVLTRGLRAKPLAHGYLRSSFQDGNRLVAANSRSV